MVDAPLASRMRPRSFDEFVGQPHLLGPGKALTKLIGGASALDRAVGAGGDGQDDARASAGRRGGRAADPALGGLLGGRRRPQGDGRRQGGGLFRTVLFVDEVHRWSKAQQDVLLPAVEDGTITLIGATTENPYFSLNTPLLSRCILFAAGAARSRGPARAAAARARGRGARAGRLGLTATDEALDHLVEVAGGDARIALTGLEAAALAADGRRGHPDARAAPSPTPCSRTRSSYDRQGDAHYDVISAFIKSIRGSDPDATLFWLARMLEAGEDPRFIARRMVVHASEDIGLGRLRARC